jgi:hypothetical protein
MKRLNRTLKEFFPQNKIIECIETGENILSSDYFDSHQVFDKVDY